MFYSNYRGRSAGRIFHYIHQQCGLHYAERVELSGDSIIYNARPFATVRWVRWSTDSDVEFPEFEFAPEYCGRASKLHIKPYDNRDDLLREAIHQAQEARALLREVSDFHATETIVINYDRNNWPAATAALNKARHTTQLSECISELSAPIKEG